MINVRFTVKYPELVKYNSKIKLPINEKEQLSEVKLHEQYLTLGINLKDRLNTKLNNIDMNLCWCNDGHVVISCSNTLSQVEKVIEDEGLEIQIDRSDIKQKLRKLYQKVWECEDIDEVFEPKTIGEKKKLKSRKVINLHKVKL